MSAAEHLVRLACTVFKTESALVALLEGERVFVCNATGAFAPGDYPWRFSFCGYALVPKNAAVMVIEDSLEDARHALYPNPVFPLPAPCAAARTRRVQGPGTCNGSLQSMQVPPAPARAHATRMSAGS